MPAEFNSFGRKSGKILLVILIVAVAGAIAATLLSYQLNV
jgi:hypothetical protein